MFSLQFFFGNVNFDVGRVAIRHRPPHFILCTKCTRQCVRHRHGIFVPHPTRIRCIKEVQVFVFRLHTHEQAPRAGAVRGNVAPHSFLARVCCQHVRQCALSAALPTTRERTEGARPERQTLAQTQWAGVGTRQSTWRGACRTTSELRLPTGRARARRSGTATA